MSFVRRFISPKVHLSEGSYVRRFIGPKVHLSDLLKNTKNVLLYPSTSSSITYLPLPYPTRAETHITKKYPNNEIKSYIL